MTSTPGARKPLLCRLNLHHKWREEHEGRQAYRRLASAGKTTPVPSRNARAAECPWGEWRRTPGVS
jgi:hypothetical protein